MKNYLYMLLGVCMLSSCLKSELKNLDYRGIEPVIINPKANFPLRALFGAAPTDSAFTVTRLNLVAKYSFQTPAPRDIKVRFIRDEALVTKYNSTFFTSYTPLPTDCYEMGTTELIIPAGAQTGTLPIKLIPSKYNGTSNYIIGFTITGSDGITIAENFKSMVFTIKGK